MSFNGKQYSDNPRSISERLHETHPEIKQVWIFNNPDEIKDAPDYVKKVPNKTVQAMREQAKSRVWVWNAAMPYGTYKGRDQYFIQTWHGDRGFKKVEYDALEDMGSGKYRDLYLAEPKICDLCIAASDYGEQKFRSAFRYEGEILKVGMPRNDSLVNGDPEMAKTVRAKLQIPDDAKVLLYAPTFRDHSKELQKVDVDLAATLSALEEKGEKWVCLVRAHSATKGINYECDGKRFIDATKYPDMADLMHAADMLISDYSSCAGDFLLRRKAIILAIFDYDDYTGERRSLKVPIEDTGYLLARTQEELTNVIRTNDDASYAANCDKVLRFYNTVETGKATDTVCGRIAERMK